MAVFATTTLAEFQISEEERRLDQCIKEIGWHQQSVMTNLMTWRRYRASSSPKTAGAALKRLIEARDEENRLFREILGLEPGQKAIPKGRK
jgi:hypothetical protein